MTSLTSWAGRMLRNLANRIDYAGTPKLTEWSFTFEAGEGARIRTDGRGCRLVFLHDSEYDRAHTESDTAAREAADRDDRAATLARLTRR